MADSEGGNVAVLLPLNDIPPHRQLLSNIDKYTDSGSDRDTTTDDEVDMLGSGHIGGDVNDIIGVSISHAQTHMRSALTPAVEKAQALEESRGYFTQEPEGVNETDVSPTQSPDKSLPTQSPDAGDILPSSWRSRPPQRKRSSISRAILSGTHGDGRKRSNSGPIAVLGSLRRMFTDLPVYPGFGSSFKHENAENRIDGESTSPMTTRNPRTNRSQSLTQLPPPLNHQRSSYRSIISSRQQEKRPKALRQTTSDNSLYLNRVATGSSKFDDTSVYATVADMPNVRYKAIADSLADAGIRIPKLPSISFSSPWSSDARINNEVTKQNTVLNSGTQLALDLPQTSETHSKVPHITAPIDKRNPLLANALSQLTGDVVFMGGYRGSVLRSAEPPHQLLWVPLTVGLNLRKVDLEVGLTHEDEERMEEKIIPSGILSHIGPIDIARRLINKARKCQNVKSELLRIHDWGYDWRLSPHRLSQNLIKYLETLECNQPDVPLEKRGAVVVAHSLGGLITRHAVNLRPELFAGVVYAGAPQNCCNILGPLRNGDDVLISSRVLTAQVNFTLRTSYALLPEDGRCFLNKTTGERYDLDFFDMKTWDEYHLSPCINPTLPPYTPPQPRKGIVESISESLYSFAPTIRTPWSSPSGPDSRNTSPARDATKPNPQESSTTDDTKVSPKSSSDHIPSPKQKAQDSLEPSMATTPHKPSIATAVTLPKDQACEYLARTLAEVKKFKAELNHIPAHQENNLYPPHAVIYGKGVPTVYGAKVANREAIKCSDAFDDLAFADGDGVVLASAAQLPTGYRCVRGGRVDSDRGHLGLLGDLEGVGRCLAAVAQGRRRGVGLGPEKKALRC